VHSVAVARTAFDQRSKQNAAIGHVSNDQRTVGHVSNFEFGAVTKKWNDVEEYI
jgi:hypothetical protein